jgi:cephalosporin hydroxylase
MTNKKRKIPDQKKITDMFHEYYYDLGLKDVRTWNDTYWLGVPIYKCPSDMIIYQEIIHDLKPDVIIECGTADGGSAIFLASICELINKGNIITIDILPRYNKCSFKGERPHHKRIKYLTGSSTSEEIIQQVENLINHNDTVMVILDSDHHKEHVLKELQMYSPLVTLDSYLIVEDTNINGHPVYPDFGPGPMEAVEEFLAENSQFSLDRTKEKLLLTFNPCGYLRRIS